MKLFSKIALGAAVLGMPLAAYAGTQMHGPKPLVSKARAEQIAMTKAPGGKIVDSEYEKEGGGWRWSFDIRQNGKIHEIGIDGKTGKIVENSWEKLSAEAHEAD